MSSVLLSESRRSFLELSRARRAATIPLRFLKSSASNTSEDASAPRTKPKGTRTRKKYAELPTAFTKPDGTIATPLAPWAGGSTLHKVDVVTSTLQEDTVIINETGSSARTSAKDAVAVATPPKRRRKVKAKTDDRNATGSITPRKARLQSLNDAEDSSTFSDMCKSPLAVEILDNLAKFPHCILLTRVGQFYESYFDQAAEVAQLLNIKLTTKAWGGRRVPMCGFPLMHLNKYLKKIVQDNGRFVALCEEFMRSRALGPKGGFDRRVTRIVTPGTLIDEPFLNPYENNYLLSISSEYSETGEDKTRGLAWIDVSTGEFFAKSVKIDTLRDELVRISPREVVVHEAMSEDADHPVRQALSEEAYPLSYISPTISEDSGAPSSSQPVSDGLTASLESPQSKVGTPLTASEQEAVRLLTAFLHAHLLEHMPRLASPNREATTGRMQIDAHTVKSLEIRESLREGGVSGCLLSVLKKTVTTGGTRLLSRRICSPSTSIPEIEARQSLVTFFHTRNHLRADVVRMLADLEDPSRIVQKFLLGRGDTSDLVALTTTIEVWSGIRTRVSLEKEMEHREKGAVNADEWASIDALMSRMDHLRDLSARVRAAVGNLDSASVDGPSEEIGEAVETTPVPTAKGVISGFNWTVRPEFSEDLSRLHATLADCLSRRDKLEQQLQNKYAAPSLSLRSSPGHGMHVHVARARRDLAKIKADPLFISISESSTTKSFFYKEWSQLGAQIVQITTDINEAEGSAFETLRSEVIALEHDIRSNARITDELDVTIAFANLAHEMHFVRPNLHDSKSYHVVNGRHPAVELGLLTNGRTFVPNTVSFSPDTPLHIVTGPNMAGKSTILRQTALIAILAQTGSYVPADSADIGIVDAIFSRVGANDDLFRNRSTFMVEMMETADILKRATPNSLVIMDEVGRGTSVQDGLAIAFATIHHLIAANQCRTLFATHFHELADLLGCTEDGRGSGVFDKVRFFQTDVEELSDGYFTYSHKLKPGVNRDSHGLKVAQMAGLPDSAIRVAQAALDSFRNAQSSVAVHNQQSLRTLGQNLAQP